MSGVDFYKDYDKFIDAIEPLYEESRHHAQHASGAHSAADNAHEYAIFKMYEDSIMTLRRDYIRRNPTKPFSGYQLTVIPIEEFEEYYALLDQKVVEGPARHIIEQAKRRSDEVKATLEAKSRIVVGAQAPDFTLNDIKGKSFTLSSLRGKPVVLDFWGSWCVWCLRSFPKLKNAYAENEGRFEVVGVNCRESESDWKVAVIEYGLPWINVYNGDNGVNVKFAVNGYPTFIVLDGEGIIRYIGHGEDEFYEYLNTL